MCGGVTKSGVQLLEWRTGEKIAETGVNGSVRSMQVDAKRGMLLIDRHSMMNDSRIFEVDLEKGFRGPYIVAVEQTAQKQIALILHMLAQCVHIIEQRRAIGQLAKGSG